MDFLQDYQEDDEEDQGVIGQEEEKKVENAQERFETEDIAQKKSRAPSSPEKVHEEEESSDDEFGPKPVESAPVEQKNKKSGDKKKKKRKKEKETDEPTPLAANPIKVINSEEDMNKFAKSKRIPISSEVHLVGHEKATACLSIEPAGNRVVTGSLDYNLKIYDFGGMDSRCRAFQSIEPQEGHPIVAVSHSPSGDRFVISTGSSQPIVYDRDGNEIIKFVKGDMYLRDLNKTKGHVMEVNNVVWHPHEKNLVLTSSLDGTLRLWDLLGQATFGCLINKQVLKLRSAQQGTARVSATTCAYSPDGQKIAGGGADGSIQIWYERRTLSTRPDAYYLWKEVENDPVLNITVSYDNDKFVVRYESGRIALWSFQQASSTTSSNIPPLWVLNNLPNLYPSANVIFNHDSSLLVCCSSPHADDPHSRLHFFDLHSTTPLPSTSSSLTQPTHTPPKEVLSLVIRDKLVGIALKWHPITNQLYITLSNGEIKILYDPELSRRGILLAVHKAPKREKDPSDYAVVGEIYAPLALDMYKEKTAKEKYIEKVMELKDPYLSKIPQKPSTQGPGNRPNTSFFFTKFVTEGKTKDTTREEDPREALLRVAEKAEKNPLFFGKAYEQTQPKRLLSETTFEEEQEEFKKKQKTL